MKVLSIFAALLFISACSSPAPSKQAPPPHSTDRSDQAYEELDKEMNK
ncbi:MAG: hypothetical protein V7785_03020 [Bermanella sp.]